MFINGLALSVLPDHFLCAQRQCQESYFAVFLSIYKDFCKETNVHFAVYLNTGSRALPYLLVLRFLALQLVWLAKAKNHGF